MTEAATRLIKVMTDNQCTIITGTPGCGKSSLAYYVAIHMQEKEGYTVLPICTAWNDAFIWKLYPYKS